VYLPLNQIVGVVVQEIGEQSVGARSVGLCQVGELELAEVGRRVLGAVEHQTPALAVVRVEKHYALVFGAVDVCHYHRLDGLECGHGRFVETIAVHDHCVHVDAVLGISHVGAPRVVALHAQSDRRSPVVVGRARQHHRQSQQSD